MRAIKFRAWDVLSKTMDEDAQAKFWLSQGFDQEEFKDSYVFMQYTGLKDKNGKEIYEGDIITGKSSASGIPVKASVDFECGSFGIEDFHLHELYDIEIIGNIYENTELLNSEQNPERSVARDDDSSTGAKYIKKMNHE